MVYLEDVVVASVGFLTVYDNSYQPVFINNTLPQKINTAYLIIKTKMPTCM